MKARRIMIAGAAALATCGALGLVPAAAQASSASHPTWTKHLPPVRPAGRTGGSMAYDAATGTVVLFGGVDLSNHLRNDTWTWNGTTWTQQRPAASPPPLAYAAMAYDAATGTTVLFGGLSVHSGIGFVTPDTT